MVNYFILKSTCVLQLLVMPSVLKTICVFICRIWILIGLHVLLQVILQEANASNWAIDTLLTSLFSSCISVTYSSSVLDFSLSSLCSIALANISLLFLENAQCSFNMMMPKLLMCREGEEGMFYLQ